MNRNEKASKILIDIVSELSKSKSHEDILKVIKEKTRDLVNSDGVTFILKDNDSCFYVDEQAISPLWKGKKFPLQACISGWAMLHKESVIIPDIYKDSRVPIEAYRPTFVKSLVMVPIRASDPIGAIGNYWANYYQATDEDLRILQALAETVSVAMENVNLYNSLQEQIKDLKSLNKSKDEFLMLLSHELRTPLNSILGWSHLLQEHPFSSEKELLMGLESIERNAKSQSRIINDLLDISKIITGKFTFKKEKFKLNQLIKLAVSSIEASALEKKIELSLNLEAPLINTFGDKECLNQVFYNLLSNAIKFTNSGGKVEVSLDREQSFARIQVKDNGKGIQPDFIPFIFDRFSQADSSSTRQVGGLGLGLSIVKYIVEAHGGSVKVESPGLNKGSIFTVYLPEVIIAEASS